MPKATVTCIILNWNGGTDLLNCVGSIRASAGVVARIVVVDNGSTDDSLTRLKDVYTDVEVIVNERNLGVAAPWNQAIALAEANRSDPVFFLNTDAIVERDCLEVLLRTMMNEQRVGIVTPRILNRSNGKVWFDGGEMNSLGVTVHRNFGRSAGQSLHVQEQDFATGCAMLVSAELLEAIQFDEAFFAYSEDADFSFRAEKAGWKILHNPQAVVIHEPSASLIANRGKWFRDYYVTRNSLMLASRHLRQFRRLMFFSYFGVVEVLFRIMWFGVTGQTRRVSAVVQGVVDFVRGKSGKRYD